MKTAINPYKNILQQIALNIRSLGKQDSVEINPGSPEYKNIYKKKHLFVTYLQQYTSKMKKKKKIFIGIDLQVLEIYFSFGLFPDINILKKNDCHLKT